MISLPNRNLVEEGEGNTLGAALDTQCRAKQMLAKGIAECAMAIRSTECICVSIYN